MNKIFVVMIMFALSIKCAYADEAHQHLQYQIAPRTAAIPDDLVNESVVTLPEKSISPTVKVLFDIRLPDQHKINLLSESEAWAVGGGKSSYEIIKELPVEMLLDGIDSNATKLEGAVSIYYCRKDGKGLCKIKSYRFTQPLKLTKSHEVSEVIFSAVLP